MVKDLLGGALLDDVTAVHKQHAAAEYVNQGSMKLNIKVDHYLARNVEREPIQRQSPQQK